MDYVLARAHIKQERDPAMRRDTYYLISRALTSCLLMTIFYSAPMHKLRYHQLDMDWFLLASVIFMVFSIAPRLLATGLKEAAGPMGFKILRYAMALTSIVAFTYPLWNTVVLWASAFAMLALADPMWLIVERDARVAPIVLPRTRLSCSILSDLLTNTLAAIIALTARTSLWTTNGLVMTNSALVLIAALLPSASCTRVSREHTLPTRMEQQGLPRAPRPGPLLSSPPPSELTSAQKRNIRELKRAQKRLRRVWYLVVATDATATQIIISMFLNVTVAQLGGNAIAVGSLLLTGGAFTFLVTRNTILKMDLRTYLATRQNSMVALFVGVMVLLFVHNTQAQYVVGTCMLAIQVALTEYAALRAFDTGSQGDVLNAVGAFRQVARARARCQAVGIFVGYWFMTTAPDVAWLFYVSFWAISYVLLTCVTHPLNTDRMPPILRIHRDSVGGEAEDDEGNALFKIDDDEADDNETTSLTPSVSGSSDDERVPRYETPPDSFDVDDDNDDHKQPDAPLEEVPLSPAPPPTPTPTVASEPSSPTASENG